MTLYRHPVQPISTIKFNIKIYLRYISFKYVLKFMSTFVFVHDSRIYILLSVHTILTN